MNRYNVNFSPDQGGDYVRKISQEDRIYYEFVATDQLDNRQRYSPGRSIGPPSSRQLLHFDTNIFISPVKITGIGGRKLDESWESGAEAYRGVMVPYFPNFFICYGPNTNTGHVSIIYMIESQILFIMKCHKYMKKNNLEYIDIKDIIWFRNGGQIERI